MRSPIYCLAGVIVAAPVFVLFPGCDSGSSELEKPAEIKKVTPENDMPGLKKMQEQLKKDGKI